MRAKLKLACSGVEDAGFTDFLNSSLKTPEKKAMLESRYSTELALYSIVMGDLDRAKYYCGNSLQMFLQVVRADFTVCACVAFERLCFLFCFSCLVGWLVGF